MPTVSHSRYLLPIPMEFGHFSYSLKPYIRHHKVKCSWGTDNEMSQVDLVEGQWQTGKSMFHRKRLDVTQLFISLLPQKRKGPVWPELPFFQEKLGNFLVRNILLLNELATNSN